MDENEVVVETPVEVVEETPTELEATNVPPAEEVSVETPAEETPAEEAVA